MSEGRENLEGVQEAEGLEAAEPEAVETQETEGVAQNDELTGTESTRDLAERAFKEEKAKLDGNGDQGQKDGQAAQKPSEAGAEGKEAQGKVKGQSGDPWMYQPPARLSAAQKETFNRMPNKLKPAVATMFRDMEGKFTQAQTEWSRATAEARHITEAVRPYYVSHPELAEAGFTESTLVAALIAKHQRLSDPKTAQSEYIKLGKELGFDPANLQENPSNKPQNFDISQHPQFIALQNQLNQLTGHYQQTAQAQAEQAGSQIAEQMRSVINEQDQFGRYRYSELHDPAFLEATKPLVSALSRTMPYDQALKRAWSAMTGNPIQQTPAGLPANSNQQPNRAMSAAVSVRGKSSIPTAPGMSQGKLPDSTRELAQMAYDELARGG